MDYQRSITAGGDITTRSASLCLFGPRFTSAQDELKELQAAASEMDRIEARIAKLEAESGERARDNSALKTANESLRAEIAALKSLQGRKVIPQSVTEEGTRVIPIATPSNFTMPSESELTRLANIVLETFPDLGSTEGPAFRGSREARGREWWTQFDKSFLAIGAMRRLPEPDRKHYLDFHTGACEAYLRTIGKSETLRGNPFLAALIAWSDVPYAGVGLQLEGQVVEVGLSEYVGRVASDASWRKVLQTGQILPMGGPRMRTAPRSPSQIQMVRPSVY